MLAIKIRLFSDVSINQCVEMMSCRTIKPHTNEGFEDPIHQDVGYE
jgi:hypothetical protein